MNAYQLPPWIWPAVVVVVCALAVWRGGDEERLGAGTVVLGWSLSMVAYRAASQETQWLMMLVDGAELPVFVWLALRSFRYWPLFAAAFKLLAVLTHLAHAAGGAVTGWAYITAGIIWSYLALVTIGYAAWTAPRYRDVAADNPIEFPGMTRR